MPLDVDEFVQQGEPEVVDAVAPKRERNDRGLLSNMARLSR